MQCEYRSAREGDVPALRELWKEAFGDGDRFLDQFFEGPFAPERSRVAVVEGAVSGAPVLVSRLLQGSEPGLSLRRGNGGQASGQGIVRRPDGGHPGVSVRSRNRRHAPGARQRLPVPVLRPSGLRPLLPPGPHEGAGCRTGPSPEAGEPQTVRGTPGGRCCLLAASARRGSTWNSRPAYPSSMGERTCFWLRPSGGWYSPGQRASLPGPHCRGSPHFENLKGQGGHLPGTVPKGPSLRHVSSPVHLAGPSPGLFWIGF